MVHKRYVVRDGKRHGPYYYTTVRDKNGNVKTIYLGKDPSKTKSMRCRVVQKKQHGLDYFYLPVIAILIFSLFAFSMTIGEIALFGGAGQNAVTTFIASAALPEVQIPITAPLIDAGELLLGSHKPSVTGMVSTPGEGSAGLPMDADLPTEGGLPMEVDLPMRAAGAHTGWDLVTVPSAQAAYGTFPALYVDSNNYNHILNTYDTGSGYGWEYSNCSGNCNAAASWETNVIYGSGTRSPRSKSITGDSIGMLHAASFMYNIVLANQYFAYSNCSNNCNNVSNWDHVVLENSAGSSNSIATDSNDNLHISYPSGLTLKYANCSNNCNNLSYWDRTTIINRTLGAYTYSSIAVDSSDQLHISCWNSTRKDLVYTNCSNNCNNEPNWDVTVLDSAGNVGEWTWIAVGPDDMLHISYLDQTNDNLKYANCSNNCNVAANWNLTLVASNGLVGDYSSIAVDTAGTVHISFFNRSGNDLLYAKCIGNCTLTSNWLVENVATSGVSASSYNPIDTTTTNKPRIAYSGAAIQKYAEGTSTCYCSTCSTCTAKLNNASCEIVKLTANITNQNSICLSNPANFSNKVFDCQGHLIDGIGAAGTYGINLNTKANNTIKDCVITEFIQAIRLVTSQNMYIYNNTLSSWGDIAVYVYSGSNSSEIVNNTITSIGGAATGYGIYVRSGSGSNNLTGNNISDCNLWGIYLRTGADNNIIHSNNLSDCIVAGMRIEDSNNNLVYNNWFNNSLNAWDNGTNYWNTTKTAGENIFGGAFLGGNYWDDYLGVDNDSDGLGNTRIPYNSSDNITNSGDWHPLAVGSPPAMGINVTPNSTNTTTFPNLNATYTIMVRNIGTAANNYTLWVNNTTAAPAWLGLNQTTINGLGVGEMQEITLYVGHTATGTFNATVTGVMTSNHSVNDTTDVLTTTVVTAPVYGVNISTNSTSSSVAADTNTTYMITVHNNGSAVNNYTVWLNNTTATSLWMDFNCTGLINNLAAGATTSITLYVGNNASGTFNVTVTAAIRSNYSFNDTTAEISTTIGGGSVDWPMFHHDSNHTGYTTAAAPVNIIRRMANYTTGNTVWSSPAVSGGFVYVGSHDDQVYQLNASNVTRLIANYTTGGNSYSSPAVAGGFMYVGSLDDQVYQLNASNISRLIANYTIGGDVTSSPTVSGGYVYATSADTRVYQLNASNVSRLIASYKTGGAVRSSPAVAGGFVYLGSDDFLIYQLNASNVSRLIASYTTGGVVRSSPAVAGGFMYVCSLDNQVYQLNASNVSRLIASYTTGGNSYSSPAVAGGYVYVGGLDSVVYQFNASNVSRLIANYTTGTNVQSSPAVAGGYVYVGSVDNWVYQLNASNVSRLIASYKTGGAVSSSPAVSGGFVYVGGADNQVYQLGEWFGYSVNISTNSTSSSVTTDVNATYTITVHNNGTFSNNYTLWVNNTTAAPLWFGLNQSFANLSSGSTYNLTLYVGSNASGTFNVTVTAVMASNHSVNDTTAEISTVVTAPATGCVSPGNITTPYYVNSSTTLCTGVYNINVSANQGALWINNGSITLDCNGSRIYGNSSTDSWGLYINSSFSNITIRNCTVHSYHYGAFLNNTSNNTLTNTTIRNNGNLGIFDYFGFNNTFNNSVIRYNGASGILLNSSSNDTISNVVTHHNTPGMGVYLYNSSNNTLTNLTVYSNTVGIFLQQNSSYNTIANSSAYSHGGTNSGIYLYMGCSHNIIRNNSVHDNGHGIRVYTSTFNNFSNNSVYNNSIIGLSANGFLFQDVSTNNTLTNNLIYSNSRGISLTLGATINNHIYDNSITDGVFDNTAGNFWNTTKNCTAGANVVGGNCTGGNYWGSYYDGVDTDGDGIGDTKLPANPGGNINIPGDWLPLLLPGAGTYGVNISTNSTNSTVFIDVNATYLITVWNNGTVANNYTLWVNNTTAAPLWMSLNQSYANLSGGSSMTVFLYVGNNATGIFNATVTASMASDSGVNDTTVVISTNVTAAAAVYGVNVSTNSSNSTVSVDVNATYTITVHNNGTTSNNYTLWVNNTTVAPLWMSLNQSFANLSSGSTYNLTLYVGSNASGTFNVTVTAVMASNHSVNDTTAVISTVVAAPAAACVSPGNITGPYHINSTTTLCTGSYNINVSGTDGALWINNGSIVLDCNGSTIFGNGSGYGVFVNSSFLNVTIRNCTVSNFSTGIYLSSSDNNMIENNVIVNNSDDGVYLSISDNNSLVNNTVTNNSDDGIFILSSSGVNVTGNVISGQSGVNDNGLVLSVADGNNLVLNNTFESNYFGIVSSNSDSNTFVNNTLRYNADDGIYLSNSYNNTVAYNYIYNNSDNGISLVNSGNNSIENNTIYNNTDYGVYLSGSSDNNITSNNISQHSSSSDAGVYASTSYGVLVSDNTFDDNYYGVEFGSAARSNMVLDNVITGGQTHVRFGSITGANNSVVNNTMSDGSGYAVVVLTSNSSVFTGNSISDAGIAGIFLSSSDNHTIANNSIYNNSNDGIYLLNSGNNTIANNSIYNNSDAGIYLVNSDNNSISNNTIYNNSNDGIYLDTSHNNTLENNFIYDNPKDGVYFSTASDNNLSGNNISHNLVGINLTSGSTSNLIYNNYVSNNTVNAFADSTSNSSWNTTKTLGTNIIGGVYIGGNYWNDYLGVDNNSDGLGNTQISYNSSEYIASTGDWNPLAEVNPPIFGVNVSTNSTNSSVNTNTNATYTITVHNNGSSFNNFTIWVNNTVSTPAWMSLNQSYANLSKGATYNLTLYVGHTAPGTFKVEVTAAMASNHSINDKTSNITTIVGNVSGVNITSSSYASSVNTNTNATYTIMVGNNGTSTNSYNLSVNNSNSATWAALNQSTLANISAGSTSAAKLYVGASSPGTYRVTVSAVDADNASVNASTAAITTTVRSGGGGAGSGGGGGAAPRSGLFINASKIVGGTFTVYAKNTGALVLNGVAIEVRNLPTGITSSISPQSIGLSPGDSGEFSVMLSGTDDLAPGTYKIIVSASDTDAKATASASTAIIVEPPAGQKPEIEPEKPVWVPQIVLEIAEKLFNPRILLVSVVITILVVLLLAYPVETEKWSKRVKRRRAAPVPRRFWESAKVTCEIPLKHGSGAESVKHTKEAEKAVGDLDDIFYSLKKRVKKSDG